MGDSFMMSLGMNSAYQLDPVAIVLVICLHLSIINVVQVERFHR